MTVSANFSFQPSADQLLRQALQLSGLTPLGRNPSALELAHARDHMNNTAKSLAAQGANLMHMERTTLALVAGTSLYTAAADTIEISFPMMLKVTGQSTETWVQHMVYDEYAKISNKETQGTPTMCYVEKLASVSLIFWPVPSQAYTVSYQRQRLMRDVESGTTPDTSQRWLDAWAYLMAEKMAIAGSLGIDRCKLLGAKAREAVELAKGREQEGGDLCITLPALSRY